MIQILRWYRLSCFCYQVAGLCIHTENHKVVVLCSHLVPYTRLWEQRQRREQEEKAGYLQNPELDRASPTPRTTFRTSLCTNRQMQHKVPRHRAGTAPGALRTRCRWKLTLALRSLRWLWACRGPPAAPSRWTRHSAGAHWWNLWPRRSSTRCGCIYQCWGRVAASPGSGFGLGYSLQWKAARQHMGNDFQPLLWWLTEEHWLHRRCGLPAWWFINP